MNTSLEKPNSSVFKSAVIGCAIMIGCILIPIVHFATAIPSPFIGGFFAGMRSTASQSEALSISLTMGIIIAIPAVFLSLIFSPSSTQTAVWIPLLIALYTTGLAFLGCLFGASRARKQQAQEN